MIVPRFHVETLEGAPRLLIGGALCLRPAELRLVWGYLVSEKLEGAAEATIARFAEQAERLTATLPVDPADLVAEVARAEAAVLAAEQAGGLDRLLIGLCLQGVVLSDGLLPPLVVLRSFRLLRSGTLTRRLEALAERHEEGSSLATMLLAGRAEAASRPTPEPSLLASAREALMRLAGRLGARLRGYYRRTGMRITRDQTSATITRHRDDDAACDVMLRAFRIGDERTLDLRDHEVISHALAGKLDILNEARRQASLSHAQAGVRPERIVLKGADGRRHEVPPPEPVSLDDATAGEGSPTWAEVIRGPSAFEPDRAPHRERDESRDLVAEAEAVPGAAELLVRLRELREREEKTTARPARRVVQETRRRVERRLRALLIRERCAPVLNT